MDKFLNKFFKCMKMYETEKRKLFLNYIISCVDLSYLHLYYREIVRNFEECVLSLQVSFKKYGMSVLTL